MTTSNNGDRTPPLLTVRNILVILLALLAGGLVTVLWVASGHPLPEAIIGGPAALGVSALGFHKLIGK